MRGLDDDIYKAISLERAIPLSLQQNPLWYRRGAAPEQKGDSGTTKKSVP